MTTVRPARSATRRYIPPYVPDERRQACKCLHRHEGRSDMQARQKANVQEEARRKQQGSGGYREPSPGAIERQKVHAARGLQPGLASMSHAVAKALLEEVVQRPGRRMVRPAAGRDHETVSLTAYPVEQVRVRARWQALVEPADPIQDVATDQAAGCRRSTEPVPLQRRVRLHQVVEDLSL